jgi:hypothetical protein
MKTMIAKKIVLLTRYSADILNRKTRGFSPLKMKISLLLFCLLFSAISSWFILKAIISKDIVANGVFVKRRPMPAYIGKPGDKQVIFFVTPGEYQRVERIKNSLDSIAHADREKYMAIIHLRPLLSDSIRMFEKLYSEQSKR